MNFEGNIDNQIDRAQSRELMKPWMKTAYEKTRQTFIKNQINPEGFRDLYGEKNVTEDLEQVDGLRKKFELEQSEDDKDVKQYSEVLEGMIYEHGELSNWFGPNAETIKTSDYDDFINGTDLIIEYTEEKEGGLPTHLSLAVDVTFGSYSINKKIERIKKDIDNDNLGEIKYFESANHQIKGKLGGVPRVVIGVEKDTVSELARAWVRGDKKALAESDVQYILIDEMLAQIKVYLKYAEENGHERPARQYRRALTVVNKIIEEKGISEGEHEWKNDKVLKGIESEVEKIFIKKGDKFGRTQTSARGRLQPRRRLGF